MKRIPLETKLPNNDGSFFTGQHLIRFIVENDQRFVGDEKGLMAAKRIDDALTCDAAGGFVDVEDSDRDLLVEAATAPRPGVRALSYPYQPAWKLLPMIAEIKAAKDVTRTQAAANGKTEVASA